MDGAGGSSTTSTVSSGAPAGSLMIAGDQQLVLSAEDAAQLLAQAGIQLGDNEQVIIGSANENEAVSTEPITAEESQQQEGTTEGAQIQLGEQAVVGDGSAGNGDGTILYIDPNDPHAAELLQQAGLQLTEDGTVVQQQHTQSAPQQAAQIDLPVTVGAATQETEKKIILPTQPLPVEQAQPASKNSTPVKNGQQIVEQAMASIGGSPAKTTPSKAKVESTAGKQVVHMAPDQQQVLYSVTGEDGQSQQYMMLCPKDMDQNLLIQTLVKQISSDPATKGGKKTIRITQQKGAAGKLSGLPPGSKVVPSSDTGSTPSPSARPTARKTPASAAKAKRQSAQQSALQVTPSTPINNDLFQQASVVPVTKNIINASEILESVVPDLPVVPADGSTRVYVKCNYCNDFRSSLNGDTWETILNHILPVAKEEIQTSFYGDLGNHFIRSLRIQINGKQSIRTNTGEEIPQCEVVLTHSLVCKKTKREFIVSNPDAKFVADLARHIRMTQPGNSGRGNSLLCIFCNSPFTYEDYIKHIQPHLDAILATLNCFSGAYCSTFYDTTIRAQHVCTQCQEPEAADLRFLPCTKFSSDYSCNKKLQFAVDCFREHYGDNGFLRLNTSTVCRCTVCKNMQQVYCAVFQISTTIIGEDNVERQDVDTQLAVCVNCQKQFINIVMKEQGFDEKLKLFQLRNMEQLCSVLRVILNQAKAICNEQKTLIYTVHENTSNPNSAVHVVKNAEVTQLNPITKLIALLESEIVSSPVKASFVCDHCLFTVDLTSMISSGNEKQKNDMLLAIVLEHLVPHTESLMNVIASTAANQTLNLKYEIVSRIKDSPTHCTIVLSLQKKFKSQQSNMEVAIDKDEVKTMENIRSATKAERKNYVALRNSKGSSSPGATGPGSPPQAESSNAGYLLEVNKFIDKQRGKLSILSQTGCNTTLLNAYAECKLCSKFSFPDFRLAGALAPSSSEVRPRNIDLCENCVETVLTLCLPTEPECLTEAEVCLALGEARLVGHRLVLSNNLKKWLSLDGVNLIKKTIDEFDDAKTIESASNVFTQGLKTHIAAVLKTCQKDEDIMHCAAGFSITDSFLSKHTEAAAALASLEKQIGMPIVEKARTEVQVTILGRRPPGAKKRPTAPLTLSRVTPSRRSYTSPANGANVINLGSGGTTPAALLQKKADQAQQEESISAIQNFIEETSSSPTKKEDMKVPAGIKITSAGKGYVNIRAVADSPRSSIQASGKTAAGTTTTTTTPSPAVKSPPPPSSSSAKTTPKSGGVRGMKGVSMVTLTANGVIKKVNEPKKADLSGDDDEGDSDDIEDEDKAAPGRPKRKSGGGDEGKAGNAAKRTRTASPQKQTPTTTTTSTSAKSTPKTPVTGVTSDEDATPGSSGGRARRQRKEKKIFDL